ncbi:MAG TPA: zeta toxin family protein [Streptosporangiaceae bacterium]|nr:zeta toxin family protein [Streptosporangiaceae bacterium]
MGIDRLPDGGDDAGQAAGDRPTADAGGTGGAGAGERAADAGRAGAGEPAADARERAADAGPTGAGRRPADAGSVDDRAADEPARESDSAAAEAEPSESRTRQEHADAPSSPPADRDAPGDSEEPQSEEPQPEQEQPEQEQPAEGDSAAAQDPAPSDEPPASPGDSPGELDGSEEGNQEDPELSDEVDPEPDPDAEAEAEAEADTDSEPDTDSENEPPVDAPSDDVTPQPAQETSDDGEIEPDATPGPEPGENITQEGDEPPDQLTPPTDNTNAPADERTRPLTDKEWAEHLTDVRNGLDKARAAGLTPNRLHTINGAGEIWTDEREFLHDSILESLYSEAADVPCDFKAIVAGGLGGAGKTTVLTEHAGIDLSQYLMINPDDFKEEMARRGMTPTIEGLSPMEASDLVHEESSYLAKRLARRAQTDGKNLIWDITMSSEESTEERINVLRAAGYTRVDGIFVEIPVETSIGRTDSRHREGHEKYRAGDGLGGRFVPHEVVRSQADSEWGSQNRKIYEVMKRSFDNWSIYNNSVDGRAPRLVESSDGTDERQDMHPERAQ